METKYRLVDRTPRAMRCGIGACAAIYEGKENDYFIVGKQVDPKELGLAGKVGSGEVLIKVPKALIDERE